MRKKVHIYSADFEAIERSSSENDSAHFEELKRIVEKGLQKTFSEDLVVLFKDLPLLITEIENRLRILLKNRPAPTKVFREDERYYEKKILGQNIIFESEYDRTMGALDAWMLLLKKAFERQNEVHFLFTECEFHDGSAHSLFLKYKKMSLFQLVEKLKIERNKIESLETVTERLRRLIDSGLLTSGIEDGTEYFSVTAKGSKIII
jgi:hypothetical protein